jgi:hypothetical protein
MICPGPQGQDRREVEGCKPEMPQRKSLESSPGLPLPTPCEFCKQPIPVKRADQEWAAHWACALAGQKRVNEALAELNIDGDKTLGR